MAFVLEESVKTTLAAGVSAGASSIDVNKASSPWNDPPDPGGNTSTLTLTDSTSSPSKIEIITYTSRTDTGTYWTLGGVTKNAYGGHGDQSWNSGDIAIQAPLTEADQWGGKTIGDLSQHVDDGSGNPVLNPDAVAVGSGASSNGAGTVTTENDIHAGAPIHLPTYTVSSLPTAGTAGRQAYATDGLKDGESSGNGSGVQVYDDGSNWVSVDNSNTVPS